MARRYSRREALRLAGAATAAVAGAVSLAACNQAGAPVEPTPEPTAEPFKLNARSGQGAGARGQLHLAAIDPTPMATDLLSPFEQWLAYSRLVAVDPRTAAIHADLAEAVEVVDPLEVRFTLRRDTFFHPDRESLAHPVVGDVVRESFLEQAALGVPLFSEVIDRIEVPDPKTVVLRLRGPFALLFELLARPEASIRSPGHYAALPDQIGSGLFVPMPVEHGGRTMHANPHHHQAGYPRLEQVVMRYFPDDRAADEAFRSAELDVRETTDSTGMLRASGGAPANRQRRAARVLVGLGMSLLPQKGGIATRYVEAFQDGRVRRAVSQALDRGSIAAAVGGVAATPVGNAHVADSLTSAELASVPFQRHDPAGSVALLRAAGREQLAFALEVPEVALLQPAIPLIYEQLAAAGITVEIRSQPVEAWEQIFSLGDFEATLFGIGGLDTPDVGLRLHASGGLDGRFSPWGFSSPVFDRRLDSALSESIPARRAEALRETQRVLLGEDPAMLPLVAPDEFALLGPDVRGYVFDSFEFNAGWLSAEWHRSG